MVSACPSTPAPATSTTRQLDALLFQRAGWFAIDEANVRVPGVRPATLDAALALVGSGRVASVVGRLREEVVGVDVDADGELGAIVVETLRTWCCSRRLWHLVRASGGSAGRAHVLIVPGVHRDALVDLVEQLRRELGLSRSRVDVRAQLRPLSAPHRRTGATPVPPDADAALTDLQGVLALLPSPAPERRTRTRPPRPVGLVPAVPMRRPRRDLPAVWSDYLTTGTRPAGVGQDRSSIELAGTFQLVIAGYDEPAAWEAIETVHPDAFTKARRLGRAWWWHVWNAAVSSADVWRTEHLTPSTTQPGTDSATAAASRADHDASKGAPAAAADEEPEHARSLIARVRGFVAASWRTWPRRTRHADLEVVQVVLARMERVGSTAVAIPQRDLVLDTTLRSRATVVDAMRRLTARGIWSVLSTYQPGTTDTANTIRLEPPDQNPGEAVPQLGPSSVSLPLAHPLALPLRRGLPSPAHAYLAATLTQVPAPTELVDLAELAGLLPDGAYELTPSQARTVRGYLDTLSSLGLATVDAQGAWRAVDPEVDDGDDATAKVRERGEQLHHDVARVVARERAEFRSRLDPERRRATWQAQRAAAAARERKAAHVRQRQWREDHPDQLAALQAAGRARYAALSIQDQAALRHNLAMRRAAAGVSEQDHHDAWRAAQTPEELARRSVERAADFAALPSPERRAYATMWASHRSTWHLNIPDARRPAPPPPPDVDELPEAALLRRDGSTLDDALFHPRDATRRQRRRADLG